MTLMEVLLTTILVSVIGVAIFQAFNNGVKLWARSRGLDHDLQAAIFMNRLGEDLRSSVRMTGIPFKGIGSRFSFPAVVWTTADKRSARADEGTIDQIGAVEYRFDPGEKKIYRRQANYSQALKGQWEGMREVAFGVEDFLARYYFPGDRGLLPKSLADEQTPQGVMVELVYKEGDSEHRLRRFYPIPVGD